MALDILVVDDELDIRELVAGVLEDEGYDTRAAADSDAALEAIAARRPSLVLLDVWLQGSRLDGLDLLDEIKRRDASIPVLVISGHGNLDTAVAAIRRGAADFIEKPFEAERLLLMVARATETERLKREVESLRQSAGRDTDLTGSSGAINGVRFSQVYGTSGTVYFETNGILALVTGPRRRLSMRGLTDLAGYRGMMKDFLQSLRANRAPAYDLARARRDVRLIEEAYAAAALHR